MTDGKTSREERLAAALRANLAKRKARDRAAGAPDPRPARADGKETA